MGSDGGPNEEHQQQGDVRMKPVGGSSTPRGSPDPYLVVSTDSHAGPAEGDLRPYCPKEHVGAFDDYVRRLDEVRRDQNAAIRARRSERRPTGASGVEAALERTHDYPGHSDPQVRLRDMDESGVAAECVFSGGQN